MSTKRKETRTYGDRSAYLKLAVSKRRRKLKLDAVTLMGEKCMICGYDSHVGVLDFHHVRPETKSFGVSSGGFSRSWQAIKDEIKKCILVCANCHREVKLGLHDKDKIFKLYEDFWNK